MKNHNIHDFSIIIKKYLNIIETKIIQISEMIV